MLNILLFYLIWYLILSLFWNNEFLIKILLYLILWLLNKSKYLSPSERQKYWYLLEKYEDVLLRKLGTFPGLPYKINLKPNSQPFCSRPYNIQYTIKPIAKWEIDRLVKNGVLRKIHYSHYGALYIFLLKKNGGVHFVTDFCKLNLQI